MHRCLQKLGLYPKTIHISSSIDTDSDHKLVMVTVQSRAELEAKTTLEKISICLKSKFTKSNVMAFSNLYGSSILFARQYIQLCFFLKFSGLQEDHLHYSERQKSIWWLFKYELFSELFSQGIFSTKMLSTYSIMQ